ncbi:related to SWI/SNF complex 60 kDa subunit [Cephalotrichum gorgonifer]|uniref:Related to SWI/SNF complex 60 kDa subunit n=1 Tax=Cephalotrichum gorgonifer TaxID=2041049 RepID=A0AAE8STD8_9PEZI|nr:related to SWI/SNF complex 60 kDa subunit [Cephalotrichum gorgonifer]
MQGQYRQYPQTPQRQGQTPNQRRGGIGPMMSAGPHPSVPLTQAQIAQQQQQQAQANELAKRRSRKPTDKAIPEGVEDTTIDPDLVLLYNNLRGYERRLDATLARKRLDMIDNHHRTLRLWITNTAEDQPWQSNELNVDSFDFSTNVEPTYRVRIEGRLLDDDFDSEQDQGTTAAAAASEGGNGANNESATTGTKPAPRFSHFFKSINVDFPPNARRPDQAVEWKKPDRSQPPSNPPVAAEFDEFCFKRNGDENINITINLTRHEEPERFLLSPELAAVVDMHEANRQEAMMAVWEYIRFYGLQEDEEKRNFRCDDLLKQVVRAEIGHIPLLGDYITPHLRPLPPVSLQYTVRVDEEFQKKPEPTIYDIQVSVDNPLRSKMVSFIHDPGYAGMLKEVSGLDDHLARLVQAVSMSKSRHTFFASLGDDPVNFFRNWLSSQTRDLETINGEASRGGGERASGDEWRKGGEGSVWATDNARETVNVILSRPKQPPPQPR